ncbi:MULTISPECIES: gluconeogenesis factor YvcK family protein [Micrococcaceae]|uniref:gluconeogenesis factor YvcK family protein n=1 Tax=unclassified Kocuria TaxID=2649579 RepID=UPI0010110B94|nr:MULTISPECIES: uridine diphosphate-N-acetylglucosamine-binding protein YvcK [unclassified Kocuria]
MTRSRHRPDRRIPGSRHSPKVVALGGGHGLYASLSALRLVTPHITAVVTVADDGGSSGRLREQFNVLPPGDLRMALSALCDDSEWGHLWREAIQHRFSALPDAPREIDGHAMGNLLLVSLWQLLGDPVAGLEWASRLLEARGRVLPMALDPLVISGDAITGDGVRERLVGQAKLAKAERVENLSLEPLDARVCEESVRAIMDADWVILGPGSWFTSVIPHLLLRESRKALCETSAKICVSMNLGLEEKETAGLGATGHLEALERYAPELSIDAVIADPSSIQEKQLFEQAVSERNAKLVWNRLRARRKENLHNPLRLAAAYQEAMRVPDNSFGVEPDAPSV